MRDIFLLYLFMWLTSFSYIFLAKLTTIWYSLQISSTGMTTLIFIERSTFSGSAGNFVKWIRYSKGTSEANINLRQAKASYCRQGTKLNFDYKSTHNDSHVFTESNDRLDTKSADEMTQRFFRSIYVNFWKHISEAFHFIVIQRLHCVLSKSLLLVS